MGRVLTKSQLRETLGLTTSPESTRAPETAPLDNRMPNARGDNTICEWCGEFIRIMIFRGTGSCSETCRKLRLDILRTNG